MTLPQPIPYRSDSKIRRALEKHLEDTPEAERAELLDYAHILTGKIAHIGPTTALEILWAIGRKMNDPSTSSGRGK